MKRILLFLFFFSSFFSGVLSAQNHEISNVLEELKNYSWTNSFEFVKYTSPEEAYNNWNIKVDDPHILTFIGGTLHEGGTSLFVQHDEHSLWVDSKEKYQLFPAEDKITFDAEKKILIFRDADNGSLHGILKRLPGSDALKGLKKLMIDNLRRLGIAGTYRDKKGKNYIFSSKENKVEGLPVQHSIYTFAEIWDFPNPILIFQDRNYAVNKTAQGLDLIPVRQFGEDGLYQPIPHASKISLKRILGPMECEYPLLSKEYFTLHELIIYGGDPYDALGTSDTVTEIHQLLNALSIMRNEIFARHGYQFKSEKWMNYFKTREWYQPTTTDVTSKLSDIEKINIELIRLQENKFKKELKDATTDQPAIL